MTQMTPWVDANMGSLAQHVLRPTRRFKSGISFAFLFLLMTIASLYLGSGTARARAFSSRRFRQPGSSSR
jgi:hypothetical protein